MSVRGATVPEPHEIFEQARAVPAANVRRALGRRQRAVLRAIHHAPGIRATTIAAQEGLEGWALRDILLGLAIAGAIEPWGLSGWRVTQAWRAKV